MNKMKAAKCLVGTVMLGSLFVGQADMVLNVVLGDNSITTRVEAVGVGNDLTEKLKFSASLDKVEDGKDDIIGKVSLSVSSNGYKVEPGDYFRIKTNNLSSTFRNNFNKLKLEDGTVIAQVIEMNSTSNKGLLDALKEDGVIKPHLTESMYNEDFDIGSETGEIVYQFTSDVQNYDSWELTNTVLNGIEPTARGVKATNIKRSISVNGKELGSIDVEVDSALTELSENTDGFLMSSQTSPLKIEEDNVTNPKVEEIINYIDGKLQVGDLITLTIPEGTNFNFKQDGLDETYTASKVSSLASNDTVKVNGKGVAFLPEVESTVKLVEHSDKKLVYEVVSLTGTDIGVAALPEVELVPTSLEMVDTQTGEITGSSYDVNIMRGDDSVKETTSRLINKALIRTNLSDANLVQSMPVTVEYVTRDKTKLETPKNIIRPVGSKLDKSVEPMEFDGYEYSESITSGPEVVRGLVNVVTHVYDKVNYINFIEERKYNESLEVGTEKVVQEGVKGKEVNGKVVQEPKNKIIEFGPVEVPFETERKINKDLGVEEERVVQEGKMGLKNPETGKVTKEPVKKIVEYGPGVVLYQTVRKLNNALKAGEERIIQEGKNGLKDSDGNIIQEPVDEIIEYGPIKGGFNTVRKPNIELAPGDEVVIQKGVAEVKDENGVVIQKSKEQIIEYGPATTPYKTLRRNNPTLTKGREIVIQKGKEGRVDEKGNLILKPVDEVIDVGTKVEGVTPKGNTNNKVPGVVKTTTTNHKELVQAGGTALTGLGLGTLFAGLGFKFTKRKK